MISDREIVGIVDSLRRNSIGRGDTLSKKRQVLLDYYNMQPYGDEVDGRSKFVSSDVSDVVEGMTPSLVRIFTQGRTIAKFESREGYEEEARQKEEMANYVFYRQNNGVLVLHNMIKDSLLQYTGTVKVSYEEVEKVTEEHYRGMSEAEYRQLASKEGTDIVEVEEQGDLNENLEVITTYDVKIKVTKTVKKYRLDNIPPEEMLVSSDARDFDCPLMIGQETPKRRSDLLEMGFDSDLVMSLPKDNRDSNDNDGEKHARRGDLDNRTEANPTSIKANDTIYLTEMYTYLDVDGDGISELYQIFEAGGKVLQKEIWDEHPYAVITPIPLPHRAVGTCPTDQIADLQFTKSVLVRQMLDNIYSTNYQRIAHNDRVDLDDLLTPRAGGTIRIEGNGPIADSLQPIATIPQSEGILQGIEYMDVSGERRTGFTRFSQGLDTESLNHTATGFRGITEYSQQRIELIARVFADTGIKEIFRKITNLVSKYQDETIQIMVTGAPMEIDPTSWREELDCSIDVGLGSGERAEKILNLNNILSQQKELAMAGSTIVDEKKIYNTFDKLITEIGLKEVQPYFNDPEKPEEVLLAENQQLKAMIQQMQVQMQQNPLAEAEKIKAEARLIEANQKDQITAANNKTNAQIEAMNLAQKNEQFYAKLNQEDEQFLQELIMEATKLELESGKNVPGAAV